MISKLKKALSNPTVINILTVGVITFSIKGLSFFKDIMVAESFGLSELLDTFFIAILIPGFIMNVFISAFTNVFIPNYIAEQKKGENVEGFQSVCFIITICLASLLLIIAFLFTDTYLEFIYPNHKPSYYGLIKSQFYFLAPCIIIWAINSVLDGLLDINSSFGISSFGSVFIPLTIIISLIFFKDAMGVNVLAISTLIGSIANLLFFLFFSLKKQTLKLGKPDFKSENIIVVYKQFPAKVSSGILFGLNDIVDQHFAAQLIAGSISALNYGIKIPSLVMTIAALALGKVFLPYFSNFAIEDSEKVFERLKIVLKYIALISAAIVIILLFFSDFLIKILFERNAFTDSDTDIVSKIQQMFVLQIPFFVGARVMVKYLTAINQNNVMVLTSLLGLILNIVLNYFLIKNMGVYGLALATSLVYFSNALALYLYIKYYNNRINLKAI